MWIEEIFIDNFGAYSNFRIQGLEPRLNVIVGPNEAGKTTMMEFVRSIFFGFRKKGSSTNTYEPSGGRVRSGRIVVQTSNGRLQIHRAEKRGQKDGLLTIFDERGDVIENSAVPVFGHGIRRDVYETLFAFDLDRMRDLDHEALRGKIIAAALGSIPVNPLDILKKLDEQSKKLVKRSHTDKESLPALQSRIGEIDKKLKAAQEKPSLHLRLTRELERAIWRRNELSGLIAEDETRLSRLEKVIQRKEEWTRLISIERRLETLQHGARFPVNAVPRLEQTVEQLNQAESELLELQSKLDLIVLRLSELNPDAVVLEHSGAIYDLSREAANLANLPIEIERHISASNRSKRVLTSEIESLGAGWDEKRISTLDVSLRLEQEIRILLDTFRECRARIKDLQVRISESEDRCRSLNDKAAEKRQEIETLSAKCSDFLSLDSRALLHEWKNNLDRVHDLDERLFEQNQQLRRFVAQKNELEKEISDLDAKGRAIFATPVFWGIVCAFLSLGTGCIAGWISSDLFLTVAALGIGTAISVPIVMVAKIRKKHREKDRDDLAKRAVSITKDLAELEARRRFNHGQIQSLKQRSRRIAEDVLQNPSATLKDIIDAEIRSAAAEEPSRRLLTLESGLRSDLADLQSENSRKAQISRSLTEELQVLERLRQKWEGWISGRGLDPDLEPEIAIDFVRKLRELKRSIQNIDEEYRALEAMERRWKQFAVRVEELSCLIGNSKTPLDPVSLVEQWVIRERENREDLAEQKSMMERAADIEMRMSASESKAAEAKSRLSALYEAAGVSDEESFLEKSQVHEQFLRLDHERVIIVESLVHGLSFADTETMCESLRAQDWDDNQEQAAFLKTHLVEMRAESEELATRCGSLTREIERMEQEDESDRLLSEKQEHLAGMSKGVNELIVTRIASHLLEKTVKLYELERQPKVLEKTSEIFRGITGNEFKRVIFPMDGASIKVERANGTIIDEELLSRGTLEQLYLSFRLAHLDVYHRDKPSIPLVMDDVIVNFDPARAKRTAAVLADFARDSGIQINFFTCHPHTADLFPQGSPRVILEPPFQ